MARNARAPYAAEEGLAACHAAAICRGAGLLWHELTGRDIGLDGVVEWESGGVSPKHRDRGLCLVQVKASKAGESSRGKLAFHMSRRNDAYWLAQDAPVLLCVVHVPSTAGRTSCGRSWWLDWKATDTCKTAGNDTCTVDLVRLRKVQPDAVFTVDPPAGPSSSCAPVASSDFGRWIRRVALGPKALRVRLCLRHAESLLESGNISGAQERIVAAERVFDHVRQPDQRRGLALRLAKAWRRRGSRLALGHAAAALRKATPDGRCDPRFALHWHYEQGYVDLLRLMSGARRKGTSWGEVFEPLLRISRSPRDRVIACACKLHANAVQFLLGSGTLAPEDREIDEVERALTQWRRAGVLDVGDFRHHRVNALAAIVLARVARKEPHAARRKMKELWDGYLRIDRSLHTLTHLWILEAFCSHAEGRLEAARQGAEKATILSDALGADEERRVLFETLRARLGPDGAEDFG